MLVYAAKRALLLVPVMLAVSMTVFFIMDMAPGDIIDTQVAEENLTEEAKESIRTQYGMKGSALSRYLTYLQGILHGDFGRSYITGEPVLKTYLQKMPATLVLALSSIFVAVILAVPLGVLSAAKHGSWIDTVSIGLSVLGLSIPNFWLGMMLIVLIGLNVSWIPVSGFRGLTSIILPSVTIGTGLAAGLSRITRSSMLDVLNQNYLRTERAKGNSEFRVIVKYAFANALIPVLTMVGGQFAACLGGSVLTETVFAWPGVGSLIIDSVFSRDVPMVVGCITLKSFSISLVVLIVDLLYGLSDPRIRARYGERRRRQAS